MSRACPVKRFGYFELDFNAVDGESVDFQSLLSTSILFIAASASNRLLTAYERKLAKLSGSLDYKKTKPA